MDNFIGEIPQNDLLITYKVLKKLKEHVKPSLSNQYNCVLNNIATIIVENQIIEK